METPVVGVKKRGRPRKRGREDVETEGNCNSNGNRDVQKLGNNENDDKSNDGGHNSEDVRNTGSSRKRGRPPKRRAVEVRGQATVGRYVLKEFEGSGVFLGKIVSYDSGLYRVDYEDGDFEDLDIGELREVLVADEQQKFVGDLLERKKKLDENVAKKSGVKLERDTKIVDSGKEVDEREKGNVVELNENLENKQEPRNLQVDVKNVEVPTSNDHGKEDVGGSDDDVDDDDVDDDSSSDSNEYGQGWETRFENEIPSVPPPELPPSSGTVGVPEEYVSQLFSVYGFLHSFSIHLFLSPFTLDDLVGCLNCDNPNTLLDAIHVSLLRVLRRHLESQASEGSDVASKCLRCADWAFLDTLTWPTYVVHYLMVMGHLNRKEWKGFYMDVLQKDYCALPVGMKLTVLQILCDDALDTAEIRTEIDKREESEVGVDYDGFSSNPLDNGPKKVYPRSAKTSIGKGRENLNPEGENIISTDSNALSDKIEEDENGDECRLCGMDGMLLCCDGCPSAYHSRCIGVSKLSIPEGEWFCHDCRISKIGPPITTETSLRGAQVFGVDPYAQLFLGTCNHLLVLKVTIKTSPFVRYYNRNDIPKVLTALCSSPHHSASYSGIVMAILKYWELPQVWLPILTSSHISSDMEKKDNGFLSPSLENKTQISLKAELEHHDSTIVQSVSNHVLGNGFTPGFDDVHIGGPIQNEIPTIKSVENGENSCLSKIGLGNGSNMTGTNPCTSGGERGISGQNNGFCLPGNVYTNRKEEKTESRGRGIQHPKDNYSYMGSLFKPNAYINHYVHGEFAACGAANFAELASDEKQPSELNTSDLRKVMSANVVLQSKAFSLVASRFFWPHTEKKLVEIPRERCSWCLHCKAPATSKKACLLNQAALNATRAPMKFWAGLKLLKIVEGGFYGIAAYMLYMEESLRGLIVGPFQSTSYQKQWRKEVEQASTCNELKSLLLDLEKNLFTIALSSEWTKLVDNWTDESSLPLTACTTVSTQKRGTGRRRKNISTSENVGEDSTESLNDLNWRSGKLTKLVFQRGTLPCSVLRKAARQGGSRRIYGVHYGEGNDVPKRSRQFIWRASVEMSSNASGLALQVRYLDNYIKWGDLYRPEQSVQDGKGLESDAYVFKTAQICDKKVVDSKIMYCVIFGHQKHLSSRLMKSIIEKEESEDGKVKYWFLDTRIPLYLIKEYEEQTEKTYQSPSKNPDRKLSKHQKRQLEAFRKRSIFFYLSGKKENMEMCLCAACPDSVLTGVSESCHVCEGYCHKKCVTKSTVKTNDDDVAYATICIKCSSTTIIQNNSTVESPTSPLAVQGQDFQNSVNIVESARLKSTSQQKVYSDKKSNNSSLSKKNRPRHWGLIWRKKQTDGDGSDFRSNNILFRVTSFGVNSFTPECQLCQKPYNPHLMYIRCENCKNWHHADAVDLDESKLQNLVGYKCCRCRRIKIPVCPYADKNTKKIEVKNSEVKKLRIKGPKEESILTTDSISEPAMSEQAESLPSTPMSLMEDDDVFIEVDDPLLLSVSKVEEIPEPEDIHSEWNPSFGLGPQKLPVRRHIKNERDDDGLFWNDNSQVQLPSSLDNKENIDEIPNLDWDASNGGFENGTTLEYNEFNHDNTDYEPQTYFSFTELLEEDGSNNQFGGVDICGEGWENLACEYSQSGFGEQSNMESFDDLMAATSMDGIMDATCNICLKTAPIPELSCQICGLMIHSQCSPWEELSFGEAWKCGNCRDLR